MRGDNLPERAVPKVQRGSNQRAAEKRKHARPTPIDPLLRGVIERKLRKQITQRIQHPTRRALRRQRILFERVEIKKNVRIFFIYSSFFALGFGFFMYLTLAFWLKIKDLISSKRSSVFDL